ncbi:MAG TPA: DUF1428 family protein [Ramlibacter sp.]|nr:DUF1428 family protein [Ramlibacter sp.]
MAYVDGFVIPVPKDRIEDYKEMARLASTVWKEHGARAYVECLGDDVPMGKITSFPQAVQLKEGEVVAFAYIVYDSREQRDAVNAKAMADPRLKDMETRLPFDGKRMFWGGFVPFIGL